MVDYTISYGSVMGKDWHSIFFKARIQPLEIPKVVGCQFGAIRLIRRIFGRANSWNRETCNIKTHHSTRGFFFHHFFILFIVAWVFVFSTKCPSLTQCSTKKLDASDTFLEKSEKSPEISIQFRVDKSPFIPIHPHSLLQEIPCKKHRLASSQWLLQNLRWKENDWGRQVMFR